MDKKLIEKVRKLLALSADAENQGSLAEAANAAQKAQDLLMKHNLSMEEVNKDPNQITIDQTMVEIVKQGWNHRHGKWLYSLYNAAAKANLCETFISTQKGFERVYIVGEEHNREIAQYLAEQLTIRIYKMESYSWRVYQGREKRGTFRRGYLLGATLAVRDRLLESFKKAAEATEQTRALVHTKDALITEYLAGLGLKTAKRSKVSGMDGFRNGHKDGKDISIHKGVKSNALNQKVIG